jgi:signal transduction histidine kinase/AcrR family transcriptional regulator
VILGENQLFVTARGLILRDGLDAFSWEALAAESGTSQAELEERFTSKADLLRQLVVDYLSSAASETARAVQSAANGEVALDAFIRILARHNLSNLDGFRVWALGIFRRGNGQFRWVEDDAHHQLVQANQAMFAPTSAKLAADWDEDLPHGIHPRRLVFVAFLAATGLTTFKAMLELLGTKLAHSDEDLITEMSRAFVSPTRVMRQLGALNNVATELAHIRDESTLAARIPQLLCEGLDFDRASFMLLRDDGELEVVSVAGSVDGEADISPSPNHRRCCEEARSIYVTQSRTVITPLRILDEVVGVVAGYIGSEGRPLDKRDISRVETFATLAGFALDNVRFNATLQAKVDARTRELREAQARLVQTEKMASQAQLVAALVHEFNTPIGAVVSSVQMLEKGHARLFEQLEPLDDPAAVVRDERLRQMLAGASVTISQGVERVQAMVTRLKAFVRLDEADRKRVDLSTLLDDVLEIVEHQRPTDVKVERAYEKVPQVACEPGRLNHAFLNLITNAMEAMPKGGVLGVRIWQEADHVLIAISDTGIGIAAEMLEHLFDPGFTKKRDRVAAGLGLATCQQIVNDHKATIEVESSLGHGSTFTIELAIDFAS